MRVSSAHSRRRWAVPADAAPRDGAQLRSGVSALRPGRKVSDDLVLACRVTAGRCNVQATLLIDAAARILRRRARDEVFNIARKAFDLEERQSKNWAAQADASRRIALQQH